MKVFCQTAIAFVLLLATLLTACGPKPTAISTDQPELAAFVQLVLPARIEIQRYWTRPVNLAGSGAPDALEVIVSAYDSVGDSTKLVGKLNFELYTRRPASSDRLERRIGFWTVALDSKEALMRHWDSLARFYRFELQLPEPPLAPGRYILLVRLIIPGEKHLQDEYEFEYPPKARPPTGPQG